MENSFNTNKVREVELSNRASIIIKGFGLQALKSKLFIIDQLQANKETANRTPKTPGDAGGMFGQPIFDTLIFNTIESLNIASITLEVVLIDVSQSRNIVMTSIPGRDGTIKEYINDGDYDINIKGSLVGVGQEIYPEDELKALKGFLTAKQALEVSCRVLLQWDIMNIVIKDYEFSQDEGMRNVVHFEISAVSENDQNLI
jgi:hypothetical protein